MRQVVVIIEKAENNYSAYVEGVDGIIAVGDNLDDIKVNMLEAIQILVDECEELGCDIPVEFQGEYQLEFKMDIKTLFEFYEGIFTKAGLEKLTGINQKQLWHYASGLRKPRQEQVLKIERALHKLGAELASVSL